VFLIITLNLPRNVNYHPASDKLLLNLIGYAAEQTGGTAVPLPGNFRTWLKETAYE